MPLLTASEMVEACLSNHPSGWKHFVAAYLPFASLLLDRHYPQLAPRRESLLREVLLRSRDHDNLFFRDYRGHSEREFLLHLRELALLVFEEAEPAVPPPEIPLPFDLFAQAFSSLTALERQVVWLYLLHPDAPDTPLLLRADVASITAMLSRAQDLLRAALDRWSASLLAQNRHLLAQHARTLQTKDCPPPKAFLHHIDGQITWRDRQDLEHHLTQCWFCIDLIARFREIYRLARLIQPLSDPEADPYVRTIGDRKSVV